MLEEEVEGVWSEIKLLEDEKEKQRDRLERCLENGLSSKDLEKLLGKFEENESQHIEDKGDRAQEKKKIQVLEMGSTLTNEETPIDRNNLELIEERMRTKDVPLLEEGTDDNIRANDSDGTPKSYGKGIRRNGKGIKEFGGSVQIDGVAKECRVINVLIGQDLKYLLEELCQVKRKWNEPCAIKYPLGWDVVGRVEEVSTNFLFCARRKVNIFRIDGVIDETALSLGKPCVVIPVLGDTLEVELDYIRLGARERPNLINVNRRTILSARIWDLLGIFAPVLIELRRVFSQSLCARRIDLDKVLEEKQAEEVQIIRSLRPKNVEGRPETHGFADGGELGDGASVFVRLRLGDGSFEVSDSKTALNWIQNDKDSFKAHVQARGSEIQDTFLPELFHFVPGMHNPADALTKHITVNDNKICHQDPSFLYSEDCPEDP
ncbi:unnamed protein product [Lepeophtheirus salmonis]|uniref:(salmon louse) hypothetical protein n=1 Tax=Lepeophtheirus salmonis TaxID=72036 RepID=A0A817FCX4_LEPSM|nr:unnamed protein product [Lepeophtheirus salmonis]CAG9477122.1 unnamed protein product [Lepeophtheirus salmonis]